MTISTAQPIPQLVEASDPEASNPVTLNPTGYSDLQVYHKNATWRSRLPFSAAYQAYGPVLVRYTATDAVGNTSPEVTVQVYINAAAACPTGERKCGDGSCSDAGVCLPAGFTTSTTEPAAYVPMSDSRPPVIRVLLDTRSRSVISPTTGQTVVDTNVTLGEVYHDAGAQAIDDHDGDLSAIVSRYGLKAIATVAPTPPAQPYIIRYDVRDSAGNAAQTQIRRVYVRCPADRRLCSTAAASPQWYCSTDADICIDPNADRAAAAKPPSVITLQGAAEVSVYVGDTYVACSNAVPLGTVCDRGAVARDPVEGDLSQRIMACKQSYTFLEFGVSACSIDTSRAGTHQLKFWVEDSATRLNVTTQRTLNVLQVCTRVACTLPDALHGPLHQHAAFAKSGNWSRSFVDA